MKKEKRRKEKERKKCEKRGKGEMKKIANQVLRSQFVEASS